MNRFVAQPRNSYAAVAMDEKRLQIEGSMRLEEGALGGTPQKKLGNPPIASLCMIP
jgi:hypothetical protein